MTKGCGGGLEYLKEGNGRELMVSVINNYLCSFSVATASTCESVTHVCTCLFLFSRENNRNKSQAILRLLN